MKQAYRHLMELHQNSPQARPRTPATLEVGQFLLLLEQLPACTIIDHVIAVLDCYRGDYNAVSILPGKGTTAGALAFRLREALANGESVECYKGGDTAVRDVCDLWIADHGDAMPSATPIVGLRYEPDIGVAYIQVLGVADLQLYHD